MARVTQERPWWLGGDPAEVSERCDVCNGTHALEVEVRCLDCDRPACPLCVVRLREQAVFRCVDCAAEDDL